MNYAIIKSGGKQYKISVGQELLLDKLDTEKGKSHIFTEVLLVRQNDEVVIGSPYVPKAAVLGRVLDTVKGEKVITAKFKAKVHYRRKIGFRAQYSKVKIESIKVGDIKSDVSAPKRKTKTVAKS